MKSILVFLATGFMAMAMTPEELSPRAVTCQGEFRAGLFGFERLAEAELQKIPTADGKRIFQGYYDQFKKSAAGTESGLTDLLTAIAAQHHADDPQGSAKSRADWASKSKKAKESAIAEIKTLDTKLQYEVALLPNNDRPAGRACLDRICAAQIKALDLAAKLVNHS